jgi:hypothetical protein
MLLKHLIPLGAKNAMVSVKQVVDNNKERKSTKK